MEHLEPKPVPAPTPPLEEPLPYAPTEDELPYADDQPMETQRHLFQIYLLIEALSLYWKDRDDVYVGGNMFVYFSPDQKRNYDFTGPDFFAVQGGVVKRERKSWVVWQDGKAPDVVIELLSESTAERDQNEKKQIYAERLRVPNYFWYDPFSGELAGFQLVGGHYTELPLDAQGRMFCPELNLLLMQWEGMYLETPAVWLRWAAPDGTLLPTRGEYEEQLAEAAKQRADVAEQEAEGLAELLAKYRARFGELPE